MQSSRPINDNRDIDNTRYINETVEHYANLAFQKLKNILGEVYPLVIRPVGNGLAGFCKGEDGNYRLYQPIANALMIPGNAAMVLADGFAPLHPNGGIGVPTAPIFGRLAQTVQLVGDIANPQMKGKRVTNPIAAATAATLAVYVGLQAMSVANGLLVSHENVAANLSVNPADIVTNLMKGNPQLYQKLIIGLAGYVGATNAFVKGRELIQNDMQAWWNSLWADVQKDQLVRHLDKLAKITDENTAKNAEIQFHHAVAAGKNWNYVDLSGRLFERALLIPANVFSFPSNNTRELTLPKAWLENNNYAKGGANAIRIGSNYISDKTPPRVKNSVSKFVNMIGWDTQRQAIKPKDGIYPSYQELMKERMKEYYILPAPLNSIAGFFGDGRRSERDQKLDTDLIQKYTQDVYNNMLKPRQPLSPPVMPYDKQLLPLNDNWEKVASENEAIQKMLHGEFPVANAQLYEKARLYNEALYSIYSTGEYKPENRNELKID